MSFSKNRDLPILIFLWRWKMASTAALALKFFPNKTWNASYRRIDALKKEGLVRFEPFYNGDGHVWTLTPKGFGLIKNTSLPDLRENGFRSENLEHDFLVSAVHLGEFLTETPKGVEFFSEQQLRRYHEEHFPNWVPKSDDRRPDGYWLTPVEGGKAIIALEVELTAKESERYRDIGEFYSSEGTINRVLWVVPTKNRGKNILGKISQSGHPRANIHNFVSVDDFTNHGWGATIQLGLESGKTIRDFLWKKPGKTLEKSHQNFSVESLLNIKKSGFFQKSTSTKAST